MKIALLSFVFLVCISFLFMWLAIIVLFEIPMWVYLPNSAFIGLLLITIWDGIKQTNLFEESTDGRD
jgi:hypothetical protein